MFVFPAQRPAYRQTKIWKELVSEARRGLARVLLTDWSKFVAGRLPAACWRYLWCHRPCGIYGGCLDLNSSAETQKLEINSSVCFYWMFCFWIHWNSSRSGRGSKVRLMRAQLGVHILQLLARSLPTSWALALCFSGPSFCVPGLLASFWVSPHLGWYVVNPTWSLPK